MKRLVKFAAVAAAVCMPGAASAQVEYTIEVDPAYPSVVYIEYDPSTLPEIYTAPGSGAGLPIIRGGYVDSDGGGSAAPAAQPSDSGSSDTQKSSSDSSGGSAAERASDRVSSVGSSPQEIQDIIIQREIEDRVMEQFENNR